MEILLEMETGDIDDLLALLYLLHHPKDFSIQMILLVPGSRSQVDFIRQIVKQFGLTLPIGGKKPESSYQVRDRRWALFNLTPSHPLPKVTPGALLLDEVVEKIPTWTYLSIGPPQNFGSWMQAQGEDAPQIPLWWCQGGYAGCNLVPKEKLPEKFQTHTSRPSWNVGGASSQVQFLQEHLTNPIHFISKNVCHRVLYDEERHLRYQQLKKPSPFIQDLVRIMQQMYFEKKKHAKHTRDETPVELPVQKAIHDLLAVTSLRVPGLIKWARVKMTVHKNQWSSELQEESHQQISVDYDPEWFEEVLLT